MDLEVEPTGEKEPTRCNCCGGTSRTVWGFVHQEMGTLAAYFVQWTVGRPEDGAHFDLILGAWGDETSAKDRVAVAVEYRAREEMPGFMIIDAGARPVGASELVGRTLDRDAVTGTLVSDQMFAVIDAIWLRDERIAEITDWS